MSFIEKAFLIVLGGIIIIIVALLLGVVKVFPHYAPGEPTAIVKAAYPMYAASVLAEDDKGEGVWEVTVGSGAEVTGNTSQSVYFKVYEQTDTIEKIEMIDTPMVGVSLKHSNTAYYILLAVNIFIFVAHIIFAVWLWSRNRLIRKTQK